VKRQAIERAIYAKTHKDYRGGWPSDLRVLMLITGKGTCSVPLAGLSEADLLEEARRKGVDLTEKRFGLSEPKEKP